MTTPGEDGASYPCLFVVHLQSIQLSMKPTICNGEDISFTRDSPGFGPHFLTLTTFEDLKKLSHSCRAHVIINKIRSLMPQQTVT